MTKFATRAVSVHPRPGRQSLSLLMACLAGSSGNIAVAQTALQFDDVSYQAGIIRSGETFGASWGDLNNDGLADIALNNHRNRDSLWVNRGDGTFFDLGNQVRAWASRPEADTHGSSWHDVDNDGDQDLMVTVGGGSASQMLINENGELINRTAELNIRYSTSVGARLPVWFDHNDDKRPDLAIITHRRTLAPTFEQLNSGLFTNVSNELGLGCSVFHYAQFYDANNDGHLDLLCGARERGAGDPVFPQRAYDVRYRPFRDITNSMRSITKAIDTVIGDFDGDLREDVFAVRGVLRPSGVSQEGRTVEAMLMGGKKSFQFQTTGQVSIDLHWNQGGENASGPPNIKIGAGGYNPGTTTFTLDPNAWWVAGMPSYSGSELPVIAIGYNRDTGTWQFANINGSSFSNAYFIVRSNADISRLSASGLWAGDKPTPPALVLNKWSGYIDATSEAGLGAAISCISAAAGDFDNDMDLDIYAACRTGAANIANILFENRGNGRFAPVPGAGGAIGPVGLAVTRGVGTADSVVVADYNADGNLDLFVTNGFNMRPKEVGGPDRLYRNRGTGNRWIELDLTAGYSLADGLGARVYATANGVTQVRTQNGGYHRWSQNDRRIHFGLANASTVDLRIEWPSGVVQYFRNVSPNQVYRVRETGGLSTATIGTGNLIRCGAPSYNATTENAILVWKECNSGTWQVRATAGSGSVSYTGTVKSAASVTSTGTVSTESDDQVSSADSTSLRYALNVAQGTQDGFTFKLSGSTSGCMTVNPSSAGTQVLFGPLRSSVTTAFDLNTGRACSY